MSSQTRSAPRPALINLTNVEDDDSKALPSSLAAIPSTSRKRPHIGRVDGPDQKRLKVDVKEREGRDSSDSGSDAEVEDIAVVKARVRKTTFFGLRDSAMLTASYSFARRAPLPTRPILESFVSSNRSDVFKCQSIASSSYMTLPYSCAYSNEAKRGRTPLLAVATEQGSVHILDTSKRPEWDYDIPQRAIFQPHANGIFDVQWSPSDTLIATASGDHSTRITSLASSVSSENRILHVLRGHSGTVKCITWDPAKDGTMLCTSGRDGSICVYDLRVGEGRESSHAEGETGSVAPVLVIPDAHESEGQTKPKRRKAKVVAGAPLRSVTGLVYPEGNPYCVVSSGSSDGILRQWDFRLPCESSARKGKKAPKGPPKPICMFSADPTTYRGNRRARGITSLTLGHGPSAGLLFGLSTDSRVHTYRLSALAPLSGNAPMDADPYALTHPHMRTHSFYVCAAASPCGRWLACGGASHGLAFLFDVSATASAGRGCVSSLPAVELRGHAGEVGALDWALDTLATCADDGTVRLWRPDLDVHRRCVEDRLAMDCQWSWAGKD